MLTTQELEKLNQLIDGKRPPSDGMEAHFLCVINGDVLPCTPKEQEWYQYWRHRSDSAQGVGGDADYHRKYTEAITAIRQRDEKINSLEEQIIGLTKEVELLKSFLKNEQKILKEKHASSLKEKDTIEALRKEVELLKSFLKNAHKTLEKYEPIPVPVVIDAQANNERKMRNAELTAGHYFTKGIYSSTDGQD